MKRQKMVYLEQETVIQTELKIIKDGEFKNFSDVVEHKLKDYINNVT